MSRQPTTEGHNKLAKTSVGNCIQRLYLELALFGNSVSGSRTRTLEQRQVRATTVAELLLYPTGPVRRILRDDPTVPPCRKLAVNH